MIHTFSGDFDGKRYACDTCIRIGRTGDIGERLPEAPEYPCDYCGESNDDGDYEFVELSEDWELRPLSEEDD